MSILLAKGLIKFFFISKSTFISGSRIFSRNQPNCIIWEICVFDKFILAEKFYTKTLLSFETCLLVSNNLRRKLVSSVVYQSCYKVILS